MRLKCERHQMPVSFGTDTTQHAIHKDDGTVCVIADKVMTNLFGAAPSGMDVDQLLAPLSWEERAKADSGQPIAGDWQGGNTEWEETFSQAD